MGYLDKFKKRQESEKLAKKVLNTQEFKREFRRMERTATVNALARFAFMMCGFLETRHGYKKAGLKKFLKFVMVNLQCTEDDSNFFLEYDKYYKDEYGLDVLGELGLGLEEE